MIAKLGRSVFATYGVACLLVLMVVAPGRAQPPGLPRMPGGGFGGGFEHVFTCSGCGKELARGPSGIKPNLEKCPFCGVRFGNTIAGRMADMQDRMNERMGGLGGWNNGPPGAGGANGI